jgi:hypothetical protein
MVSKENVGCVARAMRIVSLLALSMFAGDNMLFAHPLHTTLAELEVRASEHTVRITVRVFADDFARAASLRSNPGILLEATNTLLAAAYMRRALSLADAGGRTVPLTWYAARQTGNVLWITLTAPMPAGTLHLRNQILCDLYPDQVNIVQSTLGSSRSSVLYTRGDAYKVVQQ